MESSHRGLRRVASFRPYKSKQVGDTGPVESARRSNSRAFGSPFSGAHGTFTVDNTWFTFRTLRLKNSFAVEKITNLDFFGRKLGLEEQLCVTKRT